MLIIWLCLKEQGKRFRERWMRTGRSLHAFSRDHCALSHAPGVRSIRKPLGQSSSHVMREQFAARGGVGYRTDRDMTKRIA